MRHQRWMIVLMVVVGGLVLLALPRGAAAQGPPDWEWRWQAIWDFDQGRDGALEIMVRDRNDPVGSLITHTLRIGCTSQGAGMVTTAQGQAHFPGSAYLSCTLPDMAAAVDQLTGGGATLDPVEGYERFWMQVGAVGWSGCLTCTVSPGNPIAIPLVSMQGFAGSMVADDGQYRLASRIGVQDNLSDRFDPAPDGTVSGLADHRYIENIGGCRARFIALASQQGQNGYGCPAPGDAVVLPTGQQTVLIGKVPGVPSLFDGMIDYLILDPPNWSVIGGQ